MTLTVKLEATLEERLRRRAASTGRTTSDVVRAALQAYLAEPESARALSPNALGEDLFGRFSGPADLAAARKQQAAEVWQQRQARRR